MSESVDGLQFEEPCEGDTCFYVDFTFAVLIVLGLKTWDIRKVDYTQRACGRTVYILTSFSGHRAAVGSVYVGGIVPTSVGFLENRENLKRHRIPKGDIARHPIFTYVMLCG